MSGSWRGGFASRRRHWKRAAPGADRSGRDAFRLSSRVQPALERGVRARNTRRPAGRQRTPFDAYRDVGLPLNLMVRDVHVLARAAVHALAIGDAIPRRMTEALRDLARARGGLSGGAGHPVDGVRVALGGATGARPSSSLHLTRTSRRASLSPTRRRLRSTCSRARHRHGAGSPQGRGSRPGSAA
jgi:hypothetical protein